MLVIGTSRRPYDTYDARAVRVLLDFAASGKSLIFAGPDVMRRELYSTPDSVQPIAADGAGEATRPSAFRPMAGRASGATSSDAVLPGDKGGSSSPQLTRSRGRQLLQATKPVFNASSIPVSSQGRNRVATCAQIRGNPLYSDAQLRLVRTAPRSYYTCAQG